MTRMNRAVLVLMVVFGLSVTIGVLFSQVRVAGQEPVAADEKASLTPPSSATPGDNSKVIAPDAPSKAMEPSTASEPLKATIREQCAALPHLTEMLKTLQLIKKGSLEFTKEVYRVEGPATVRVSVSEAFMAFDYEHQLTRFDHQTVYRRDRDNTEATSDALKFIRNGDDSFHWDPGRDEIRHHQPDEDWPHHCGCEPFDVRIAGICGSYSWRWSRTFEDARRVLQRDGAREFELGDPGWSLLVASGVGKGIQPSWRRSILLDPNRESVPQHYEIWLTRGPPSDSAFELYETIDVQWIRFQDVYVPGRVDFFQNNRDGSKDLERLQLSWKSVNRELSSRLFSVEDFAAPEGTSLVDYRFGFEKRRTERRLGPPPQQTAAGWIPREDNDIGGEARQKVPVPLKERIARALEQPIRFDFIDTPLDQVLQFFNVTTKIPIRFDPKVGEAPNLDHQLVVTCKAKDVLLRDALDLVLQDLAMTYSVGDDAILISTADEANQDD